MSTILVNRVGERAATDKASDRLPESPTVYEEKAIEWSIKVLRSDDERLYGDLSYSGAQADALRGAPSSRGALPEAARPVQ